MSRKIYFILLASLGLLVGYLNSALVDSGSNSQGNLRRTSSAPVMGYSSRTSSSKFVKTPSAKPLSGILPQKTPSQPSRPSSPNASPVKPIVKPVVNTPVVEPAKPPAPVSAPQAQVVSVPTPVVTSAPIQQQTAVVSQPVESQVVPAKRLTFKDKAKNTWNKFTTGAKNVFSNKKVQTGLAVAAGTAVATGAVVGGAVAADKLTTQEQKNNVSNAFKNAGQSISNTGSKAAQGLKDLWGKIRKK